MTFSSAIYSQPNRLLSAIIYSFVLFIASNQLEAQSKSLVESAATLKTDDEVFHKWKSWQYLYSDQSIDSPKFIVNSIKKFNELLPKSFQNRVEFLSLSEPATKSEEDQFRKSISQVLTELDSNTARFVDRLKNSNFTSNEINDLEQKTSATELGSQYRELLVAIFNVAGIDDDQTMFALSNRLFEYSFGKDHGAEFGKMLSQPKDFPIARLFFATLWYRLSGDGWRVWHTKTLSSLANESKAGKEVIYIAGGTDVYHLIKSGVRRIRVIDPIFPSQTKYYSEGWQFLVDCQSNDTIKFQEPKIILRRDGCKNQGNFQTDKLSDGQAHTIPKTIVEWTMIDESNNQKIGHLIYERRFATQADFSTTKNQVLLISFNELAYATDVTSAGWGFDPDQWPNDIKIYVKQLRKPIGKIECVNLKQSSVADFRFIRLGTSIN
ncbi:MAG: hypothetical protein H3C43_04945 [Leptonema sp. (in: Bacteria)]|nr:hypothetical protein [Leptonema sp. (in: bacteria)]